MSYYRNKRRLIEREELRAYAQRSASERPAGPHLDLEPYARDAENRTPREILSTLAGQSTWRTPDSGHGHGGGARPVLPYSAELTYALARANDPVGRALAAAIAMPNAAVLSVLWHTCWGSVLESVQPRGTRGREQAGGVLKDVLLDMVHPNVRKKPTVPMRRSEYLRLYRDVHAHLDGLAMTAEREALDALRAG